MTLYDKLDFHEGPAVSEGQPPENGFTHIGFFLAWLIRRDLHDPDWFRDDDVQLVKTGEMTGSDLSDAIDGKLVSHFMNRDGSAFADARYDAYLAGYGSLFAGYPDYGVADEPATFALAEELLDHLYAEWVDLGRPVPEPKPPIGEFGDAPTSFEVITPPGYSDEDWAEVVRRTEAGLPFEPPALDERYMGHGAPELERRIPRDATSPAIAVSSTTASQWGSSRLNRALKRLGTRPRDATVASGIGGEGDDTVMVAVYAVPGASRELLDSEFATVIERPPGGRWSQRAIGRQTVNWADGDPFSAAYWTEDGIVYHVGGGKASTEHVVRRILGSTLT